MTVSGRSAGQRDRATSTTRKEKKKQVRKRKEEVISYLILFSISEERDRK